MSEELEIALTIDVEGGTVVARAGGRRASGTTVQAAVDALAVVLRAQSDRDAERADAHRREREDVQRVERLRALQRQLRTWPGDRDRYVAQHGEAFVAEAEAENAAEDDRETRIRSTQGVQAGRIA